MKTLTEATFSFNFSFEELAHKHEVSCTCGAGGSSHPLRHARGCALTAFYGEWTAMCHKVWRERLVHVPVRPPRLSFGERSLYEQG